MTTTNLMDASRNLMTRPSDQHFDSFGALRAAADQDNRNARCVEIPVDMIGVDATAEGRLVVRSRATGKTYPMTHYSARQIASLAGANPDFVFDRLTANVAADALDDSLSRVKADNVVLHLGTLTNSNGVHAGPVLRGVTSTSYARVSDSDFYAEIDARLTRKGFVPARPTKNTDEQRNNVMGNNKPCLFRGDRDSFAFFMHEELGGAGAGGRPIRTGIIAENSEVGARSVRLRKFTFDDLCANFIIWGAKELVGFRAIHRGSSSEILRRVNEQLAGWTPDNRAELEIMIQANHVQFAADLEKAFERLTVEFELSQALAKSSLMLASASENRMLRPLSVAAVANGVTSLAKSSVHADKLVELASLGGRIYESAMVGGGA